MPTFSLPYSKAAYFSTIILDYLDQKPELSPFYHCFPSMDGLKEQVVLREQQFDPDKRMVLASALESQYKGMEISESTRQNISRLRQPNCFTITTGHQLNLFSGPLYFLYKIFSVINLCEQLKAEQPDRDFVPVYWMASEDHDFDEINYFNLNGKKFQWDRADGGAVGDMNTKGLDRVADLLQRELGNSKNGIYLTDLFKQAYLDHQDLSSATRFLANRLFSSYGLVIVDGNDAALKNLMVPYFERELNEELTYKNVTKTSAQLESLGYKRQVNPREINLFYLQQGDRSRIVRTEEGFALADGSKTWTESQLLDEVREHPKRISPNALLRPLYQEIILPNICYIGGGGELAYWLQLKSCFEAYDVPFPVIMLRNSALLATHKQWDKFERFDIPLEWLFLNQRELTDCYTHKLSDLKIDFSSQREHLVKQFTALHQLAAQTDASFEGAVAAQEKKQINGLDRLEKRLLKAQRRKLADHLERLVKLQNELFPNHSLQERGVNFSQFYLLWDIRLMDRLKQELNPLDDQFSILVMAD